MPIQIDKSLQSVAVPSCCGGKDMSHQQATPAAIKAEEVKAKPKNATGSCCGGATVPDAAHGHATHD